MNRFALGEFEDAVRRHRWFRRILTVWPRVLGGLICVAMIGCSAAGPVGGIKPVEIDGREYSRICEAAGVVLREYGFSLDRRDYRFGRITSKPLASPTVFEPWDRSATTIGQSLEDTINSQRRSARVSIDPMGAGVDAGGAADDGQVNTEGSGSYRLMVEVTVERQQAPVRRLIGSTDGVAMTGQLTSVPTRWRERGIEASYWQRVGTDPLLERRLMADIIRKAMTLRRPGASAGEGSSS